jgi:hypothetical protein
VRAPSIDNGTVFYIHHSDTAVLSSTEDRAGVANNSYKGTWPLKETPVGIASVDPQL